MMMACCLSSAALNVVNICGLLRDMHGSIPNKMRIEVHNKLFQPTRTPAACSAQRVSPPSISLSAHSYCLAQHKLHHLLRRKPRLLQVRAVPARLCPHKPPILQLLHNRVGVLGI